MMIPVTGTRKQPPHRVFKFSVASIGETIKNGREAANGAPKDHTWWNAQERHNLLSVDFL